MSFADKILRCRDCGADFIFTAGEQEFYAMKGLMNEPGRCPACRGARRSQRDSGGMSYSTGGYDRPRREMDPGRRPRLERPGPRQVEAGSSSLATRQRHGEILKRLTDTFDVNL